MILKSGISGFHLLNKIICHTDEKEFFKICCDIANNRKYSLKRQNFIGVETNYFAIEIEVNEKMIVVLLNKHYPFVAFSEMKDGFISEFINNQTLESDFREFYYVLNIEELMTPITYELIQSSELNIIELRQIEYWKPNYIGEIIFNYWD